MRQVRRSAPISGRIQVLLLATVFGWGVCGAQLRPDFGRDDNGDVILLDTPHNWQMWTEITDWRIQTEVGDDQFRPGRPDQTWNDFWVSLILENATGGRENWPRYTNYIIEKRSEAGLPPLEGLPAWYFEQAAPDDEEPVPDGRQPESSCADSSPTCIA